jgi:hypothetical protein
MNVQLLPAALVEITVLRRSGYRGAGFLLGTEIGRLALVERLLPLDFDRKSAGAACGAAFEKYAERLLGAFFCRKPPFALDWFIGDLVLAVRPRQLEVFTCAAGSDGRARLEMLPEDAEG